MGPIPPNACMPDQPPRLTQFLDTAWGGFRGLQLEKEEAKRQGLPTPPLLPVDRAVGLRNPIHRSRILIGFALLLALSGLSASEFDAIATDWVSLHGQGLRPTARAITDFGAFKVWVYPMLALTALGALLRHARLLRWLAVWGLSYVISGAMVHAMKFLLSRPRPTSLGSGGETLADPLTGGYDFASYPSGHSADAAVLATIAFLVNRRLGLAVLPIALVLAATRVLTLSHWVGDCIAGLAFGALGTLLVYAWATGPVPATPAARREDPAP